jgi:hypothetical protein
MALPTDEEKKKLLKSFNPLPQAALDFGTGATPNKTFFDIPNIYSILGKPPESPKSDGSTPIPASGPTPPLVTDPNKSRLFGASSVSSLSGGKGSLGSDDAGGGLGGRSSSSLDAPARALGTESGAMRREARRLRKQGYGDAAQKMALGASMARLNEPKILTQEQRGRNAMQAQESGMASQEAAAAQAEQAQYMRDLFKKRQADLGKGITPPYAAM